MAINFKDTEFSYLQKSKIKTDVLKKINCKIEDNKITAIIGPNGGGKTTLVELVATLLYPTGGSIDIEEINVTDKFNNKNIKRIRSNTGIAFQFADEQFFEPTVYKEIMFGMKQFNYKTKNKKKRVLDSLILAGLNPSYLYKNPFELSSSEKRKVTIASILSYNPKVLIFDEPTVGLDDKAKINLMRLLKKLRDSYDKTIIIISHDINLLFQFTDNFIVIKDGKIINEGTKYEVFDDVSYLKANGISVPKIVEFTDYVLKNKKVKLGKHDDIKELMKAIYRNVK